MRLIDDLSRAIVVDDISGCHEWTGAISGEGYGYVRDGGSIRPVHRVIVEKHRKRKLTRTQEIDHLCRNRRCVNIKHLEIVPHRINVLRGIPFRKPRGE